ncbi:MAG: bifunctional folylpolyglutamate synthase/dihydrofolate synthase, partial [Clostridia bacterium]|nr:bifunctional folylpolyglutamate synthase/dihydrofolate synthase [Clostridia bacterium]
MIYSEAISYIKNIERAGSDYGIERMRLFLDVLGRPDEKLKIVHVAGTNGKGSVCAYMTSVLMAAGYKVGTYNSPSVFCYNERWRIDGKPLSDELVAKYLTKVKEVIDGINSYICGGESALDCDGDMLSYIREFVRTHTTD